MALGHNHSHAHAHPTGSGRLLAAAVLFTLAFAGVEAAAGWWAGSLALLGDAGHMLSDSVALALAAVAAWIALRPPTVRHSYGLERAEVVGALINGLFMMVIVTGIVIEALERVRDPRPVAGGVVIGVAAVGLLVNLTVVWVLSHGERTLNIRGAMLHVFGDLLGSLAALVSGTVIVLTGWTLIDPLLSLFICALILFSSLRLIRDALHVIMEGVPPHIDLRQVGRALAEADPHVREVHDLHVWGLSSGRAALSAHLVLDDMRSWPSVLRAVRSLLHERFGIEHVTLQPETDTSILQPMAGRPAEPGARLGADRRRAPGDG